MAGGEPEPLRASNPRIKRLARLIDRRRARSQERAFVVEGPSLVAEALAGAAVEDDGRLTVEAVFHGPGSANDLAPAARRLGVPLIPVAAGVLESVLDPVTPQPVAAVVGRTWPAVDDLAPTGPVLCLVEARDPGNVGTIIRSAEAAGAAAVVLAGPSVDPTNPKVVRASAGAILRLPVVSGIEAGPALDHLAATGRPLVATMVTAGATPYDTVDLTEAAIVLGNESHGLAEPVIARCTTVITIPHRGPTESLNLGVAGSLLCFEAFRQRRNRDGTGGDGRPADIR